MVDNSNAYPDIDDSLLGSLLDANKSLFGKYTTEFDNEIIYIDSSDWRDSNFLKFQIISGYLVFILFGLAEQTVGTLIPKFQEHYKINDIQASFVFLASVAGYFIMAFLSDLSHTNLGVKGVLVMGTVSMTFAYLGISTYPPFAAVVFLYIFHGVGLGSIDASLGMWMGKLVDSNEVLGILHGCYGIGCMISPTLITSLLERKTHPWAWPQYYLVLSCLGAGCVILMIVAFKNETPKKYRYTLMTSSKSTSEVELEDLSGDNGSGSTSSSPPVDDDSLEHSSASFGEVVRSLQIWLFALFLFTYVGNEVAFGSWLISFLTRVKSLSYEESSHLTSTFWAGLTAGRIILGFVTLRVFNTELTANFAYTILTFLGYFSFWLMSLGLNTSLLYPVAFFTGCFVGPIFPTTIISLLKTLPAKYHTAGIGFICAFGGGGGAVIPFLIGLVAESPLGLDLFPVIISMIAGLNSFMWVVLIKKYGSNYSANKL